MTKNSDGQPRRTGFLAWPLLNRLLGLIDALSRGAANVAAIMVVALALLILAEIVASSLLGAGLEFAFEYGSYLFALIIFAGAPHAMRTGGHIRVSLILSRTRGSVRRGLEIYCTALAFAISVFIAYAITEMAVRSFDTGSRTYLPSETLLGYPQGLLAIASWLFALQIAARLIRCFVGDPADLDDKPDEIDGGKV